jgi:hypothetical protein
MGEEEQKVDKAADQLSLSAVRESSPVRADAEISPSKEIEDEKERI